MVDIRDIRKHEFRDPVHGFIDVYAHEKEILDTVEMQRLRHIHQLGLQSYVYHGAEHSRFGHSIGVMHLAGEIVDKIFDKNEQDLIRNLSDGGSVNNFKKKLYLAARLAGLLHDIGHAPFSHSGEALFGNKKDHEDYGVEIILGSKIASIIDDNAAKTGIMTTDVISILNKLGIYYEAPFINTIISSPWDADKMDYLLRDSIYCGVQYGKYDLHRLIDTLTLDGGYMTGGLELAIQEDGIHTVEQLILARYFMFTQVYFHDVRRVYDIIVQEFIGDCLEEEYGERTYPLKIDEYIKWNDDRIFIKAKEMADGDKKNIGWRIIERRHYKTVYDTSPHPNRIDIRRFEQLLDNCKREFKGIKFCSDGAVNHPENFKLEDIPIMSEHGDTPKSFAEECKVLGGLQAIEQYRVYAEVDDDTNQFDKIHIFCRDFMNE